MLTRIISTATRTATEQYKTVPYENKSLLNSRTGEVESEKPELSGLIKGIHFGKYAFSFSCRELDEQIDATLMSVC